MRPSPSSTWPTGCANPSRHAGITVAAMAAYLGVSRKSVGNWIGGRIDPDTRTLRLWALRCGVSYEWLTDGGDPRRQAIASTALKYSSFGKNTQFPQASALGLAA